MADIDWPLLLPDNFLQEGYTEGNINNVIKSTMDSGPEKRRPKSTNAYLPISGGMHLTLSEKLIFDDFYKNTISFGALAFNMPTYAGGTIEVFLNSRTLTPLSGTKWKLTMTLITLV